MVRIKRFIIGKVPKIGLLVSGMSLLLAFAGTGPADAAVTATGNGITISVVSVQLVNKVAVNVNFAVTCSSANDPINDGDTYGAIINFTLSENIKGNIVTNSGQTGGGINPFAAVTCDGTPQPITVTLVPTGSGYKAGPAYISNVSGGAWDSDFSCGSVVYGGQLVPAPCDSLTNNFAGGVQINGGTS